MAAVPETGASQRDATQALWSQYHASVYRYALSQLRSPQDAEDATQNTFLRAFNALNRGVVPENEAAWLFKIAHNTCKSSKLAWLRRRRVEAPHDIATLDAPATEQRYDELAGLDDALARMPPRPREAFLLREWQGLSYAEIAERMNTSQSAVETLIFRARRTLAEQLERPLRRARQALGLGPLFGMLRGWLGGGSLAVKAAGVAAVVATASVAATQVHHAGGSPHHGRTPAVQTPNVSPAPAQPAARTAMMRPAAAKHVQARSATAAVVTSPPPPAPASTPQKAAPTPTPAQPQASPTTGVTLPALPTPPSLPAVPPVFVAPDLPSVPDVPTVPAVPSLPAAPHVPGVPPVPALPPIPAVLQIPAAPAVPAPPQLP
jgi:RNA polymerase sigma factor (sigma-70 family)